MLKLPEKSGRKTRKNSKRRRIIINEGKYVFLCSNARSLIAHKDEIESQVLEYYKSAIVVLTETRVTNDIEDNEINIKGYTVVRCDSESRDT